MDKPPRDWSKVQRTKSPYHVNLRLTPEEHERLTATAAALGVSKAGYAKSVIFGRPIPKVSRRPKAIPADLRQILGLLGKLGSNANQIARARNVGEVMDGEAARTLQSIRAELEAMRALLLAALEGER